MIESIKNPYSFKSLKSDNWNNCEIGKCKNEMTAYMGENARSNTRGSYFLYTNEESPFGKSLVTYKVYDCGM